MKNIDLSKIFGSKSRAKILEKFLLEYEWWNNSWFHMRGLSRDLDEQINSIKRELDNLTELGILKYRMDMKKKMFYLNENFELLEDFIQIFLKSYDPIIKLKEFFKWETLLELIIINKSVQTKLISPTKSLLDIFLIWEIDKEKFSDFINKAFFGRKVKYAIISTPELFERLEYWDKLIKNILTEPGNIFIKDNLKIKEKLGI